MVLILTGITLLAVGTAIFVLELYRTNTSNPLILNLLSYASLRFLPRLMRVLIFAALGAGLVGYGIWRLNRAFLRPFLRPGEPLVDQLTNYQKRDRGPRIVAIGGGR